MNIQELKKYFNCFSKNANDIYLLVDSNGIILDANDRAYETYQYEKDELKGQSLSSLENKEQSVQQEITSGKPAETESAQTYESIHVKKDLSLFPVEISQHLIKLNGSSYRQLIIRDITDHKDKESKLNFNKFVVDNAQDSIFWLRMDGSIIYANTAACQLLGYSLEELEAMYIYDIDPNISKTDWTKQWEVYTDEGTFKFETQHRTRDGQILDVEIYGNLLKFEGNKYFTSIVRDITERKTNENKLNFNKFVVDNSPDSIFWLGMDGSFIYANKAACQSLGYSMEELESMHVYDINTRMTKSDWHEQWGNLVDEDSYRTETQHQTRDGRILDVEIFGNLIKFEGNKYFTSIVRNITERKLIEKDLRFHKFTAENAPDSIFWVSNDGSFSYVNKAAYESRGYTREELQSMKVFDLDPGLTRDFWFRQWENRYDNRNIHRETRHLLKDGGLIDVEIYSNFLNFEGAEYFCAIVRDVTDRKLVERDLRFNQFVVENASDSVYWMNPDGSFYYVNKAAYELLGYSKEELQFMHVYDIDSSLTRESWNERWQKNSPGNYYHTESQHLTKDGRIIDVDIHANYIKYGGKEYLCSIVRDITERKVVEKDLRFSRFTIDHAPDSIFWVDFDGRIIYTNNTACDLLGYSMDELLSMHVYDFDAHLTRESWEIMRETRAVDKLELIRDESQQITRDGRIIDVEIYSNLINYQGTRFLCSIVRDISERKLIEKDLRFNKFAVDNATDSLYWVNSDGGFIYANHAACQSLGYTPEEFQSMYVWELDPLITRERWYEQWENRHLNDYVKAESQHRAKGGRVIDVEIITNLVKFEGIEYFCSIVRDITERNRIEQDLRFNKFVVENASDSVYWIKPDGGFYYVNRAACESLGYRKEELESMHVYNIDVNMTSARWIEHWKNRKDREYYHVETQHQAKDGRLIEVEVNSNLIVYENNQYLCSFVRDITERKLVEKELRFNQFVIDHAPDCIYWLTVDGKFFYANKAACDLLGYTLEEFQSMSLYKIAPHLNQDVWDERWEILSDQGYFRNEAQHHTKDGRTIDVDIYSNLIEYEGNKYLCSIVRDITDSKNSERLLQKTEEKMAKAFQAIPDAIIVSSLEDGRFIEVNEGFEKLYGYSKDQVIGKTSQELGTWVNYEDRDKFKELLYKEGSVRLYEIPQYNRQGERWDAEVSAEVIEIDGKMCIVSNVRDITRQKEDMEEIQKLSQSVEYSPNIVMITDKDSVIEYVNSRFTEITGYQSWEVLGKKPNLLSASETPKEIYEKLWKTILAGKTWRGEFLNKKKNGELYWASQIIFPILNDKNEITHFVSLHEDVTEVKLAAEQLSYQATHDALTGLINRPEFEKRLERVLITARMDDSLHAFCFLDLDQFKVVNDTSGHVAGDQLLRQLGSLLRDNLRQRDTIARLGGDEFGILMEHCSLNKARQIAETLRAAIEEFAFVWEGQTYSIGVSIGIAMITANSLDVTEVMKQADAACYMAKDAGRNRVHVYHDDDDRLRTRQGQIHWVPEINAALAENRFQLFAQPIVPVESSDVDERQYEILIRLETRHGELISPGAFLPAAERFNQMLKIDRWVIDNVFNWLAEHPDWYDQLDYFSINLSGSSLSDKLLLRHLTGLLSDSCFPSSKLSFEVTETAAIANLAEAQVFISMLKDFDCKIILDDFGSGLSSFAYLKRLPVDVLKIDGMFVRDIDQDRGDYAMVKMINELAQAMGIVTIAEFVESVMVLEKLREIGVNYAQGYYISSPMPIDDIVKQSYSLANNVNRTVKQGE